MFIISGLINFLAGAVGTTPAGLCLFLSILAGYPLVGFYRSYVADEQIKGMHHLFFTLSGLALCILNFGSDVSHSLIAVSFTYFFLTLFRDVPEMLIASNFIFHMLYMIIGYFMTATDDYHICWTMPHCMLVLRMIGLACDLADGLKKSTELSKEQTETALHEMPSMLEIFAFAYFPFTFLIGPLFNFKRYKQFVNGDFSLYSGGKRAGVQRLVCGLFYMAVFIIGGNFLPNSYMLSDDYRNEIFPIKLILLGAWGKVVLSKYISCWLLVEGALMCLGFTYNGKLENGESDWSGCANVRVFEFETGLAMQHYIKSFNVCTNNWISRYVYKRLKQFEHRQFSHLATLAFLAVWHGLHSGYYVTFLMEYFFVIAERQMAEVYANVILPRFGHILMDSCPVWEYCNFIIIKTYDIILMGFAMIPFTFLTYDKYMRVYGAVYYFGFVLIGLWFAFYHFHKSRRQIQQRN